MKQCKRCNQFKSESEYRAHRFTQDGLQTHCADCMSIMVTEGRQKASSGKKKTTYSLAAKDVIITSIDGEINVLKKQVKALQSSRRKFLNGRGIVVTVKDGKVSLSV
jgi:hypothetical protein